MTRTECTGTRLVGDELRQKIVASLNDALRVRVGRGEGVGSTFHSFSSLQEPPVIPEGHLPAHASPLTSLSTALGVLLFPLDEPPHDGVLFHDELSAEQRDALGWVIDHGLSVPAAGIPFTNADDLKHYLNADGPLAATLEVSGRIAPVWSWLHRIGNGCPDDERQRIFDALLSLTPTELLDVAFSIQERRYPNRSSAGKCLPPKDFSSIHQALVVHAAELQPRVVELALDLAASDFPSADSSKLLVDLLRRTHAWPAGDRLLPILQRAVYGEDGEAVFRSLTPFQQLRCAAWVGNHYTLSRLIEHVELAELAPLFVANVMDPGWRFDAMNTERCLKLIGEDVVAPLRAAEASAPPRKHALIRRVLKEMCGEVAHVDIVVESFDGGLRFVLKAEHGDDTFTLGKLPRRADYKPIGERLMQLKVGHVHFKISEADANASPHLGYQITHGLSEHVRGMTLHLNGSSLSVGE